MTTRVDIEDVEATKSEKLLALVLSAFLLIGGLWAYVKVDDYAQSGVDAPALSAAQRASIERLEDARLQSDRAAEAEGRARDELELRREAYRTALDAGRTAPELERQYEAAQARLVAARQAVAQAEAAVARAQPAADEAFAADRQRFDRERRNERLVSFGGRFLLTVLSLVGALVLLARLRRRHSRWLALGVAAVGSATVLSLVLATDYVTDYIDPLDLGPLVLSLVGIAATLLAFWALQRYLARRLPARRARKAECPFCGYPVRDRGPHCEGCGRRVVAACSTCEAPRRVGAVHCAACGT